MRNLLKALLITAAATGAAALLLKALDLDGARPANDAAPPFPGADPEEMPDEDIGMLLKELASQLEPPRG